MGARINAKNHITKLIFYIMQFWLTKCYWNCQLKQCYFKELIICLISTTKIRQQVSEQYLQSSKVIHHILVSQKADLL